MATLREELLRLAAERTREAPCRECADKHLRAALSALDAADRHLRAAVKDLGDTPAAIQTQLAGRQNALTRRVVYRLLPPDTPEVR